MAILCYLSTSLGKLLCPHTPPFLCDARHLPKRLLEPWCKPKVPEALHTVGRHGIAGDMCITCISLVGCSVSLPSGRQPCWVWRPPLGTHHTQVDCFLRTTGHSSPYLPYSNASSVCLEGAGRGRIRDHQEENSQVEEGRTPAPYRIGRTRGNSHGEGEGLATKRAERTAEVGHPGAGRALGPCPLGPAGTL